MKNTETILVLFMYKFMEYSEAVTRSTHFKKDIAEVKEVQSQ